MGIRDYIEHVYNELAEYQKAQDLPGSSGEGWYIPGSMLTSGIKLGIKALGVGVQLGAYLIGRLQNRDEGEQADDRLQHKEHIAIVIDISRRSAKDVARYLDAMNIDANMVLLCSKQVYDSVPVSLNEKKTEQWTAVVQEFNMYINQIKHEFGSVSMHIFIAAPVALAFGLGCVWGTVDKATVYHWGGETYFPVLPVSRALRASAN